MATVNITVDDFIGYIYSCRIYIIGLMLINVSLSSSVIPFVTQTLCLRCG